MLIEIDFNSDEALYVQLQNQIIMGIATATIQEGESLPSVRQLADTVGINMHTVNKAYSILKQEGFIQLDRRRGAVIAIDADKAKAYAEVKRALRIALAKGSLKNVSREEVHEMVDDPVLWQSFPLFSALLLLVLYNSCCLLFLSTVFIK